MLGLCDRLPRRVWGNGSVASPCDRGGRLAGQGIIGADSTLVETPRSVWHIRGREGDAGSRAYGRHGPDHGNRVILWDNSAPGAGHYDVGNTFTLGPAAGSIDDECSGLAGLTPRSRKPIFWSRLRRRRFLLRMLRQRSDFARAYPA